METGLGSEPRSRCCCLMLPWLQVPCRPLEFSRKQKVHPWEGAWVSSRVEPALTLCPEGLLSFFFWCERILGKSFSTLHQLSRSIFNMLMCQMSVCWSGGQEYSLVCFTVLLLSWVCLGFNVFFLLLLLLFVPLTSSVLGFSWHKWHKLGLCSLFSVLTYVFSG